MVRYFTAGVWDLFHIGHLNFLRKARMKARNALFIVGVVTDESAISYKGYAPIFPYSQRKAIIESLVFPDFVVSVPKQFDTEQMEALEIDVLILGIEWSEWVSPELKKLQNKCPIIHLPRTPGISTTDIIAKTRSAKRP